MKNSVKQLIKNVFSLLPIDNNLIVMESEGDLSDNTFALYEYMYGKYGRKYRYVWLVNNVNHKRLYANTRLIEKSGILPFIQSAYYLSKCNYFIYDHNNIFQDIGLQKKRGQIIINLWHGCGFKYSEPPKEEPLMDYLLVTGEFYTEIFARLFNIDSRKIINLGYPRNDYFFRELNERQMHIKEAFSSYSKVVLWMPTFRKSWSKDISEEYFDSLTGLPILESETALHRFDVFLKEKNVLCIFKIHHLQAALAPFDSKFSNIRIVSDNDIESYGIQLYQYIMLADALITDYSSVSTDYVLLDKPIVYTMDDYNDYKESRGFNIDDPARFFTGYHIVNEDDLYSSICEIAMGKDVYQNEREKVKHIFHDYVDGQSSYRILKRVGIE